MSQLQCPNCGGYAIYNKRQAAFDNNSLLGIIIACIVLFPLIPFLIYGYIKNGNEAAKISQFAYVCRLCNYEWEQRPGQTPRINVNSQLIQQASSRLGANCRVCAQYVPDHVRTCSVCGTARW